MSIKKRKFASKTALGDSLSLEADNSLSSLVNTLKSVNTTSEEAKKNEASMDDNNGSRVWYNWLDALLGKKKKKD